MTTPSAIDSVLVSPEQLSAMMGTEPVVIIDTRDADTYAAGHLPGAVNMREIFTFLATSTAEGLSALKSTFAEHFGAVGLSGAETAVFYEDALNSGYGQSCRGYYLLTCSATRRSRCKTAASPPGTPRACPSAPAPPLPRPHPSPQTWRWPT